MQVTGVEPLTLPARAASCTHRLAICDPSVAVDAPLGAPAIAVVAEANCISSDTHISAAAAADPSDSNNGAGGSASDNADADAAVAVADECCAEIVPSGWVLGVLGAVSCPLPCTRLRHLPSGCGSMQQGAQRSCWQMHTALITHHALLADFGALCTPTPLFFAGACPPATR